MSRFFLFCLLFIVSCATGGARLQPVSKVKELNHSAVRCFYMCDYLQSYDLLLQALDLCEKYPGDPNEHMIHANMGNIYFRFKEYNLAKLYYTKALGLCKDSTGIMLLYNNISETELARGEIDSALYHVDCSLEISSRTGGSWLHVLLNTKASVFREKRLYDRAFHALRSALDHARRNGSAEFEAENLSDLGRLFFETQKIDSATGCIAASNAIARENKFYDILLENHLALSKIEESRGHHTGSLDRMRRYSDLKDSIFSADRLMEINNLQRLWEVSKTDRQIKGLGWTLTVVFAVLLLVAGVLLSVFIQKRRLNKAYKTLFEKNLEIMELKAGSPRKKVKNPLPRDNDEELLGRILKVMEDVGIICDPNFSINMLASLVHSNNTYVSQVINNGLNKNFRSLLNEYRICEAQRLFARPDAAKYTIESVSLIVGYKSRSTFREAFAGITGVSPGFYLKSIQDVSC